MTSLRSTIKAKWFTTKPLLAMAVQLSLNQMARRVLLVTDTAFLGRLGTKELAGVALANLWINVPFNFVQYAIPAITILCSQAFGAKQYHEMGIWYQTSIVFAMLCCIPVGLIHLFVGDLISISMNDTDTIHFGNMYGWVMATALVPRFLFTRVCITMVLNVVLNQVFIYGVGSWNGLGFIGSPLATVVSSYVQVILFCLYTITWKQYHGPYWNGWCRDSYSWKYMVKFLVLAMPMGSSSAVDWLSLTVAGMFLGTLAPEVSAANAVLFGLFGVVYACISGFAAATQIFMSRSIGECNLPNAKLILIQGTLLMIALSAILIAIIAVFQEQTFGLWSKDSKLCSETLFQFLLCIELIFLRFLLSACANAVDLSQRSFYINNLGAWAVFAPLTYVFVIPLKWGLEGYWIANSLGECIKVALLLFSLMRKKWLPTSEKPESAV
ncbi:hypothetical protein THRCLA_04162 [Thraustotheca clavata]|uniref:Multidrug/Oligosaccharidyl-lipid/Polysaccharide (MOP) Flippase Superfamily n=1 Tax=Thraustotheca clavata TaxID=74557 RepID=A0A1W0A004_9STRA|nr:hypothetical protein THRCLA_04162 [Thraustotheca clavata]